MRRIPAFIFAAVFAAFAGVCGTPSRAADGLEPCAVDGRALGVSRIVEIDTTTGPLFGSISTQAREPRFLEPKEVVLTFDDGPLPLVTRSILDTLDRFCTKATFFSVGRMAIAYPSTVRAVLDRGHTLGSHTWSHPLTLRRLSAEKSIEEIEKGHAAVTLAAGRPIAPFFRFPGLSDNAAMLRHLQDRGIAAFTVDAVSNDSYISDPDRLLAHALKEVELNKGGIVLFHDIKIATARMLPRFLAELHARGYTVVHMRPKGHVDPLAGWSEKIAPMMAKIDSAVSAAHTAAAETTIAAGSDIAPVTAIAPNPRKRPDFKSASGDRLSASGKPTNSGLALAKPGRTAVRGWTYRDALEPPDGTFPAAGAATKPSSLFFGTWGATLDRP